MKNLKTIFNFEFSEMTKKKSIIVSTAIISGALFLATFIPRFLPTDSVTDPGQTYFSFENTYILSEDANLYLDLEAVFSGFEGVTVRNGKEDVEILLEDENIDRVFVVKSDTEYEVFTKTQTTPTYQETYEDVYYEYLVTKRLDELGVDVGAVQDAQDIVFNGTHTFLGKDAFQGLFFAFAMLFALYMLILIYGQTVATSVAREKDNRTMELLITSTKPKALIIGKVLAVGLMGLIQLASLILALVIGYLINKSTYPDIIHYFLQTSVQLDVIVVYLVFTVLGYLLYLFIFAALGSLVSKVEDVASAVTPVTFLFVAAYMVASFGMNAPDATIVKVSSYIPFISLFTTPIRYMMTNVPVFELVVSILMMIVTTFIIMQLSIVIYRQGSLNYGNRMNLIKVIKSLIKKESIV